MSDSTGVTGEMTLVVHGIPIVAFPGGRVVIAGLPLTNSQAEDVVTAIVQANKVASLPPIRIAETDVDP